MKTTFSILIGMFAVLLLTSCVNVARITMSQSDCEYAASVYPYKVKDFFEILPGKYIIKKKGDKLSIDVKVRISKKVSLSSYSCEYLELSVEDDNERAYKVQGREVIFYSSDRFSAMKDISKADVGDIIKLEFELAEDKQWINAVSSTITDNSKLFIELSLEEELTRDSSDYAYSSDSAGGSSSDSNWDSLLDEYEMLVDRYISYCRKAQNGDLGALSDYTSILAKVENLAAKLDDAEDDMTTSQVSRYIKITNKITEAAANAL